jgi:hypothetical protein
MLSKHQVRTWPSLRMTPIYTPLTAKRVMLQRGLTSMEWWCELLNIKINEDKTRDISFAREDGPAKSCLTLKGLNITIVNQKNISV